MTAIKAMNKAQKELAESNKWDVEAVEAYISLGIGDDDLSDFEESYQGQYANDEDFAQSLAEDLGEIPRAGSAHWPLYCIDWEWAARELMMDYSEANGYYFRNL